MNGLTAMPMPRTLEPVRFLLRALLNDFVEKQRRRFGEDRKRRLTCHLRLQLGSMAGAGIALGAAMAFAVTRVMKALLFGVSATDPTTQRSASASPP